MTREAHYHVGEVHPNLVYPLDFLPKITQRMSDNMSCLQQTVGEPLSDEEQPKLMMTYGYNEHVMEAPAAAATPQGQPEPPQPQPTADRGVTAKSESTTVSIARKSAASTSASSGTTTALRRSIHKPRELARRHSDGDQRQPEAMSMSAPKAMEPEVDNTQRSLEEDFRRAAAAAEEQPDAPMKDEPELLPAAPEPQQSDLALPPWMACSENKLVGGQRRLEAVMNVHAQRIIDMEQSMMRQADLTCERMKKLENDMTAESTKRDAAEHKIKDALAALESRLTAVETAPPPHQQPPPPAAAAAAEGGWVQNTMVLGSWPPPMSKEDRIAAAAAWAKHSGVPHLTPTAPDRSTIVKIQFATETDMRKSLFVVQTMIQKDTTPQLRACWAALSGRRASPSAAAGGLTSKIGSRLDWAREPNPGPTSPPESCW